MERNRYPRTALAAFLAAATLAAGCGATPETVPPRASSTPVSTISTPGGHALPPSPALPRRGHGGRGGSGNGSSAAAGGLPPDWPADLPVPQGSITGSTGSAGRWTVLIIAAGSAAEVRQSTVALYAAAGFVAVSDSVLNKGNRQITLVVENRDHSATQTNLVIGVTTR
jgi:hypothetical protein